MRLLAVIASLFLMISASAQDIHFSQFEMAPSQYNPGLTGVFDAGCQRLILNHRQQWRSITDNPYKTFGLAVDSKDMLKSKTWNFGFAYMDDIAGDSRFSTGQFNLSAAKKFKVSADSLHHINAGAQLGFTNRVIDYTNLQFDNQYNGFSYDPGLPTEENFARNSRFYLNFNLGATWIYDPDDRRQIIGGVSLYNITKPKQSFYNDFNVVLDRRFNIHLQGTWPLGTYADILPAVQWGAQGKYREMLIGARYRYWLHDQLDTYSAAYVGAFARTQDAGYVMIGMDYNAYTLQLSYDINTSDLEPASNNRGGFEVSFMVRLCAIGGGPQRQQYIVCPDYL